MNTVLATALADDRRRQFLSDAAIHADAHSSLRASRVHSSRVAPSARRARIRPVHAFRTWLAAGLL